MAVVPLVLLVGCVSSVAAVTAFLCVVAGGFALLVAPAVAPCECGASVVVTLLYFVPILSVIAIVAAISAVLYFVSILVVVIASSISAGEGFVAFFFVSILSVIAIVAATSAVLYTAAFTVAVPAFGCLAVRFAVIVPAFGRFAILFDVAEEVALLLALVVLTFGYVEGFAAVWVGLGVEHDRTKGHGGGGEILYLLQPKVE